MFKWQSGYLGKKEWEESTARAEGVGMLCGSVQKTWTCKRLSNTHLRGLLVFLYETNHTAAIEDDDDGKKCLSINLRVDCRYLSLLLKHDLAVSNSLVHIGDISSLACQIYKRRRNE